MECKHCKKDVPQTEGKRARQYCNDACRKAHKRTTITGQFESLPADVQRNIERFSDTPEERASRIAAAIRYQRVFPSPYARGISHGPIDLPDDYKPADQLKPGEYNRVSKPGDPDYEHGAGQCKTCGVPTPIEAITKCKECIEAIDKASEALSATPEPVEAA